MGKKGNAQISGFSGRTIGKMLQKRAGLGMHASKGTGKKK